MNSIPKQSSIALQSLNDLVAALSEEERMKYGDIISSVNLPLNVFQDCCSWSDDCYTRNCIVENEKFELILICWESGQLTPIHDHGGEECWVKIIKGKFRETIYKVNHQGKLANVNSIISVANDITYMKDFMGFHRLENLSKERSMSLHLYAKPIRDCNIFDEDSMKFVHKKMTYNTVSEFEVNIK